MSNLANALAGLQKSLYWRDCPYGPFPSKGAIGGDEGDGGDDCLWLGLLTSVDFAPAATALRQCQASADEKRPGMFYRNPIRRYTDNEGYGHFFSRDMGMGVLCALGSKYWDHVTAYQIARDWQLYIEKNRACLVKKPKWMGGGCAVRGPYQLAPDDRSVVTPAFWALIGRVWRENGWPVSSEMERNNGMDGDWSIAEAENCPLGYQLHLHAIESYLKLMMGQSREYQEKMARICYDRSPLDRFYKLLVQKKALPEDIDWLVDLINSRPPVLADNWIWGSSNMAQAIADHDYCGWDLLFLGNLMMKLSN